MQEMYISEKDNMVLKACRETSKNVFLYGAGKLGRIIADKLLGEHVRITGFVVDSEFSNEDESYQNIPVLSINDINLDSAIVIVAAECLAEDKAKLALLKKKTEVIDADVYSFFEYGDERKLDYEVFLEENNLELNDLYHELADDKSRKHMTAFWNQKISGNYRYLENLWGGGQYYDSEIVNFNRIESFVDCGAYNGDSYTSFLENYKRQEGKEWVGKAYLFEPVNYEKCLSNCGKDTRCKIYRIGSWSKRDQLMFSVQEVGSSIIEEKGVSVDVDAIDNILGETKVDFIKMDIEGSELEALKGAKKVIRTCKPILAICVYHKREDLITIPQYIWSLCPDYKMYIRAHCRFTTELVLYAVPD